jgi:Flp pilus assembly protein TadD
VKSSGVILGPYTRDELVEALKLKTVTIIDEIRDPGSRWGFIREHAEFSQVVQMLRDEQSRQREDTGTMSLTKTHTDTITDPHQLGDELTPTPVIPPTRSAGRPEVLEAPQPAAEEKFEKKSAPTYVFKNDEKIRRRMDRTKSNYSLWAWVLCLIVIVAAGGVSYRVLSQHKESQPSLGFDDCVRLAKYNQALGIYDLALKYYKKATAIHVLDPALRAQMAFLLMVVEDQNAAARQVLEALQAKSPSDDVARMIALSYLREGRLQEARTRFEALLQKDAKDEVAQENLLMIEILDGKLQSAYDKLSAMVRDGVKDPLMVVYKGVVAYKLFNPDKDRPKLLMALEELHHYAEDFTDYRLEILLYTAALQSKLGNETGVAEDLGKLFGEYPDLTRDHIHHEMFDREILKWSYLAGVCDQIFKKDQQSALEMGLKAYCAYQRGDMKTALDLVEKARDQFSLDQSLIGLHAFLLMQLGRDDEAKTLFQLPQAKENKLVWAVHGDVCEKQKDWACADESWHGLLSRDSKSLEALRGMVVLSLNRGQREMAGDLIKRGLLISDNYRPLVALKEQVDAH